MSLLNTLLHKCKTIRNDLIESILLNSLKIFVRRRCSVAVRDRVKLEHRIAFARVPFAVASGPGQAVDRERGEEKVQRPGNQ